MRHAGSAEGLLKEPRRKFRANSVRTELAEELRLTATCEANQIFVFAAQL